MAAMTDDSPAFCVECSNDPGTSEAALVRYFSSLVEAQAFMETGTARRFRCIWLSELGKYETKGGKVRTHWIYFWWSPETGWGEVFGRRTGYPEGQHQIVSYSPLSAA